MWFLFLLLLALTWLTIKGFFLGQVLIAVRQDYESLRPLLIASPAELAQPANIVKVEALLSRSESDLRSLRDQVGPLFGVTPLLAWIPRYGGDIAQAGPLVDYAIEVTASGQIALQMYRSLVNQISSGGVLAKELPRGQVLLSVLDSIRPSAADLRIQIARAVIARQKIDLRQLSYSSANLIRRGDTVLNTGGPALRALNVLPELLGARGPRRYVFVAQNNDELRATGGYISVVGTIQVLDGKITEVNVQDSYAVEDYAKPHPWPPKPLTDYMRAEMWVVRDANWSPDFPTTAKAIEDLYELNQGIRADGVIAVNLDAVQRLVAALAPIELPAYGERVDGENVLARMQYYLYSPAGAGQTGDWWSHRKDFMAALMQTMMARLNGENGAVNAPRVGQALWENLFAKDMLIYLNDPSGASVLNDLHWDGALPIEPRDVALVVDSNVGWTKADLKIERRFDYRVELKPGQPALASLRMQYRNLNPVSSKPCILEPKYEATYAEMQNACYWNYVRLYVPQGSKPLSATSGISATLEAPELGYTVVSGYFLLPRGETREIRFDYELPFDGLPGNGLDELGAVGAASYRLTWLKQPGAPDASVNAMIVFPSAWQVVDAEPTPVSISETSVEFALAADRDATLSVKLARAANPIEVVAEIAVGLVLFLGLLLALRYRLAKVSHASSTKSQKATSSMPASPLSTHACPWLGSDVDSVTHYGYPSPSNVCFSPQPCRLLSTSDQWQYCLVESHQRCPYFVQPSPETRAQPATPSARHVEERQGGRRFGLWMGLGFVILVIAAAVIWAALQEPNSVQPAAQLAVQTPTSVPLTALPIQVRLPTATVSPSSTAFPATLPSATPVPAFTPTPTATRVSTATPTVTLAEVTPTTAKSVPTNTSPFRYPAPRLLAPANNMTIARVQVELKWETVADLHADEWYDVQVWKPDEKPHGVSWTREGRWTMPADFPSGKYQWRIVVIRGKDGQWIEDVSPPSETWTLNRQ